MILFAAAFLAGDTWTWNVGFRYADAEGLLLDDRERWTVRIGLGGTVVAERAFLGTVVADGTLVPTSDARPETLRGKIERDGTLSLEGRWSDPTANRVMRRILDPDRTMGDRVAGWPVVRRATLRESGVWTPGGGVRADLVFAAALISARLGGKSLSMDPLRSPASLPGGGEKF